MGANSIIKFLTNYLKKNITTDNYTINGVAVSEHYDLMLAGDGVLGLKETSTPTADANHGKVYTKNDNKLYFQDGAGSESEVGAGGGGGRTLIEEITPSSTDIASFTGISGSYSHLEIELIVRSTRVATYDDLGIFFNNDTTTANYRYIGSGAYGGGVDSNAGGDGNKIADISAASSPTDCGSIGHILIPYYAKTTFNKSVLAESLNRRDSSSLHLLIMQWGTEWEDNSAITRVDLKIDGGNYVSGSIIRLYGVT